MKDTWNEEYYRIINFFYWEPQHLGKIKNPKTTYKGIDDVLKHLRKMEVTLNHQLNIFFKLAPNRFLLYLFSEVFKQKIAGQYQLIPQDDLEAMYDLRDATHPDFFFMGEKTLLCIEMKINAKSSLEQVMKYAMLSVFDDMQASKQRDFYLLFIGKSTFRNLWKQKYEGVQELRTALSKYELPAKTRKGHLDIAEYHDQIRQKFRTMEISFINYQNLADILRSEHEGLPSDQEYTGIYSKLLSGLVNELAIRGLAE